MIPDDLLEAFSATLLTGGYNLLLGSGVSLDSHNGQGELLRSSDILRKDLCALKNVRDTTNLPRVYSMLSPHERQKELVERFSSCRPGPSLTPLSRYLWRRVFSFNIDDVIELLYSSSSTAKQTLIPLNFDAPFEPTPERNELLAVHLHGWVGKPESGFVFSHSEYARIMSSMNPWMHLLSEILATESFVIAGTSLNEVDLEYYLSHRSEATPRRSRGPSLLIEPFPDQATEADCKRYGLTLVKATFAEFLGWLQTKFPNPPSIADLVVPDAGALFPDKGIAPRLLRFFSDFRLISASNLPRATSPSPFLYGRAPSQDDLNRHADIPRIDNGLILADIEKMLGSKSNTIPRLMILFDDAGVGKTTLIQRLGYELTRKGQPVLAVHTLSRIDERNAIECFSSSASTIVLIVDGLADHAEQIHALFEDVRSRDRIIVVAAEREYRRGYVELVFDDTLRMTRSLQPLNQSERKQLVELYRQYGLVANADAVRRPDEFAMRLKGQAVAIAACQILNDFRPLDVIVESLWSESEAAHRLPYLCAALARHCHVAGIRYSILQSIVGPRSALSDLFTSTVPLRLTDNVEDNDYTVPMNTVIGERILHQARDKDKWLLLQAFSEIAKALAPHVNRYAVMRRSPEARLASRLFDVDKIVKPLLAENANKLYISCQLEWEWNSRYWEQRALLAADSDLDTALRYARHAVAIENHPFTLTTLGKLLLRQMESDFTAGGPAFDEAFEKLSQAVRREAARSRISVHPYTTIFSGTVRYLELGGKLNATQRADLTMHIANARANFGSDTALQAAWNRLETLL